MLLFSIPGASALPGAANGPGTGMIYLNSVMCSGNETGLLDCGNSGTIGSTGCTHNQDVSVICDPQVCKCIYISGIILYS